MNICLYTSQLTHSNETRSVRMAHGTIVIKCKIHFRFASPKKVGIFANK